MSRRLIEYERFKVAAEQLAENPILRRDVFKRDEIPERKDYTFESLSMTDVTLVDLLSAFKSVLDRVGGEPLQDVSVDRLSIADAMAFVLDRLESSDVVRFSEIMEEVTSRSEAVAFFLAILELARISRIGLYQSEQFGEISIVSRKLDSNLGERGERHE
jgi:segregation and condensation protein A